MPNGRVLGGAVDIRCDAYRNANDASEVRAGVVNDVQYGICSSRDIRCVRIVGVCLGCDSEDM